MKTRLNKRREGIKHGIAAGSALLLTAPSSQARVDPSPYLKAAEVVGTEQIATQIAGNAASDSVVVVTLPDRESRPWTAIDSKRFKDLVVKRALGEATEDDHQEFKLLQKARRTAEEDASPREILAECMRRRFYNEMLEVLTRNVRFLHPKDYEKLGSLR